MITIAPLTLEGHGVRLEPLGPEHEIALSQAVRDGSLWQLWFTAVPEPEALGQYIATARQGLAEGHMLPWAVRELTTGEIVGSTRYHDIVASIDRVEIGYTWYALRWQRSHVNSACKRLLFEYAFERLGCKVVGLRTDRFNFRSQRAIEALGAQRDGIIRHSGTRRDGSPRDTVMYSVMHYEWPEVRRHLDLRLMRHAGRA